MASGPNDLVSSHFTLTGSQPMTPPRFSFAERAAAAAEAGFAGIGLLGDDYFAEQEPASPTPTRPRSSPTTASSSPRWSSCSTGRRATTSPNEPRTGGSWRTSVWAVADAFGPRVVSVGELVRPSSCRRSRSLAERFGALCDRAAAHGLLVALEFMPFCGIPDIATGRALVEAVGRAERGPQRRLLALLPRQSGSRRARAPSATASS